MARHQESHGSSLALIILCLVTAISGCNRVSSHQPQSTSAPRETGATEHELDFPPCPPGLFPMLTSKTPKTGHHKVFLSWGASASSGVGYCLYRRQSRSEKKNVVTRLLDCKDCEQVNRSAVFGTACVDDLVKDTAAYDYVAIAINANGQTSVFSNIATARIPAAEKRLPPPLDATSYPACRVPASSLP